MDRRRLDNEPESDSFAEWYSRWLDRLVAAQLELTEVCVGRTSLGLVEGWFVRLLSNEIQTRDRGHRFPLMKPRSGRFDISRVDGWDRAERRAFLKMLTAIADDFAQAPDPVDARLHEGHSMVAAAELVQNVIAALR